MSDILELHLRTTKVDPTDFLKSYGDSLLKCIVSLETTPHRHYHCYILLRSIVEGTFRNKVLKTFGKGNENYSLSKKRGNLEAYVVKDGNIVYSTGFTPEELAGFKAVSYKKGKRIDQIETYVRTNFDVFKEIPEVRIWGHPDRDLTIGKQIEDYMSKEDRCSYYLTKYFLSVKDQLLPTPNLLRQYRDTLYIRLFEPVDNATTFEWLFDKISNA